MAKAIAMLSGGLDSTLAARLIMEQGIELEAVNFLTVFCNCTTRGATCLASKSAADKLGIKLKVFEVSREYFSIVRNPRYGYGSNLNPCLDCRIFMFKKTAEYMKQSGASFIITGEVLGQRPMSQRKDAMRIIERDSGLEGLILRPLSAKMFEPTIPEKTGLVDREKLLAFQGRSRKPQIELAAKLHVNDYPCPAGGCLLTDDGFANRMRDLMEHKPDFDLDDVKMLKIGRHFRITPEAKLIVGRDKDENRRLLDLARADDFSFYPISTKGPVGIGKGVYGSDNVFTASRIIARYSDGDSSQQFEIACKRAPEGIFKHTVLPMEEEFLNAMRI